MKSPKSLMSHWLEKNSRLYIDMIFKQPNKNQPFEETIFSNHQNSLLPSVGNPETRPQNASGK